MALMIDQELGDETAVEVAVWDLEHGRRWLVRRSDALQRVSEVITLLDTVEARLRSGRQP
jgi:hypothetical protein